MNDYKVKCDLPMHKDVYFFGHGIDIDNPYEMANEIIDLKRQKQELIDYLKDLIDNKHTNNKVLWFDSEYAKIYGELYIWGEILNPEFQKKMLEILETE